MEYTACTVHNTKVRFGKNLTKSFTDSLSLSTFV